MKNYFLLSLIFLFLTTSCKKEEPITDPGDDTNSPPSSPSYIVAPSDGETDVETSFTITWSAATDADADPIKYNVYLGLTEGDLSIVSAGQTTTGYTLENLEMATTYFLRVEAFDGVNAAVSTEIRQFETGNVSSFIDARDGTVYGVRLIGDQVWMDENLKFNSASSYSYADDASNDDSYGRLYEWGGVEAAIPEGWHLPTDDEWKTLETQLGMPSADLNINAYGTARGTDQGTQLREGGSSGLDFPLAGFRSGGTYSAKDNRTYLWVNTTVGGSIFRRRLVTADPSVYRFTNPAGDFAISIRLVRD